MVDEHRCVENTAAYFSHESRDQRLHADPHESCAASIREAFSEASAIVARAKYWRRLIGRNSPTGVMCQQG